MVGPVEEELSDLGCASGGSRGCWEHSPGKLFQKYFHAGCTTPVDQLPVCVITDLVVLPASDVDDAQAFIPQNAKVRAAVLTELGSYNTHFAP